jgi:tetratricopeptide (TPR) repeat protein
MPKKTIILFLFVLLLAYAGIFVFQTRINRAIGEYHQTEEILFLPSGQSVKKLSLGFESLVADIYWIRAVQYYGGGRIEDPTRNMNLLFPLLDITTTLDPAMIPVYQFGAVFLSEPKPIGAEDPGAAIALLRKGIAANPGEKNLYLSLGFVYYWQLKDYKRAAGVFLEGSEHEQGTPWLRNLAADTMARGGDRVTSRHLWEQIYNSSPNRRSRENALAHLLELKAEEEIEALEKAAARFRQQFGRPPQGFFEMIDRGFLRGIPVDPSDVPYILDPDSGEVYCSADTKLLIVPE